MSPIVPIAEEAILPIPQEVSLWRWTLSVPPAGIERLHELLTQEEKQRAEAFITEKLAHKFIAARAGLRQVIGELTGVAPAEVAFHYGPMGKPELSPERGLFFNLAHSADEAILAVATQPVGVDLERLRPMPRAKDFAERWFHPEEKQRLHETADVDHLTEFFRIWTAKESALKLLGKGVGEALPKLLTPAGNTDGKATELPANSLGVTSCWVTRIDSRFPCCGQEWSAAIATCQRPIKTHVTTLDLASLL